MNEKCNSCKNFYLRGEWSTPTCEKIEKAPITCLMVIPTKGDCPFYEVREYYEPGY